MKKDSTVITEILINGNCIESYDIKQKAIERFEELLHCEYADDICELIGWSKGSLNEFFVLSLIHGKETLRSVDM